MDNNANEARKYAEGLIDYIINNMGLIDESFDIAYMEDSYDKSTGANNQSNGIVIRDAERIMKSLFKDYSLAKSIPNSDYVFNLLNPEGYKLYKIKSIDGYFESLKIENEKQEAINKLTKDNLESTTALAEKTIKHFWTPTTVSVISALIALATLFFAVIWRNEDNKQNKEKKETKEVTQSKSDTNKHSILLHVDSLYNSDPNKDTSKKR